MINWKVANRWGWLLTVSTILTALSLVPIFVERQPLDWLGWFATPAGLVMMLFRPTSSADFLRLGAVGLVVNMVVIAVALELLLRGISLIRKHRVAHS